VAAATLPDDLTEGRERTLALVAALSDADVEAQHVAIMSPLVWDLAHIAAYEELWLVHRHGGQPLTRPELAAMYDAFETPRAVRGDLPLLDREQALEYLADVRERVVAMLGERGPGDGLLHELVLRHEQQHGETMLQAIELARLTPAPAVPRAVRPPAPGGHSGLEAVEIPAGPFLLGAPGPDQIGFAYDNERPRHLLELPAYRIGRTAVTNATFLAFVEGGGYERREWWSHEGWAWKQEHDITCPDGWEHGPGGWRRWTLDGPAPIDPDEIAVHVSWFEADALARAHGARLPTEAEWEKAATWDPQTQQARRFPWGDEPWTPERANLDHGLLGPAPAGAYPAGASPSGVLGMLGDTWEWTASEFGGYPGFRAHPYREYSEVFFGEGYKVLRGGSWATRARVATPTFRNWDLPQRRQIFSGVRLAWDA
jgi:gamma-glutamyl hercynylcysteine S-oxide synthase